MTILKGRFKYYFTSCRSYSNTEKTLTTDDNIKKKNWFFFSIMKIKPKVVLNVGHAVVNRMSAFVRQIDFALDWSQLEAGRALFRYICIVRHLAQY